MITDRIDAVTGIPKVYLKPILPAPRSVKIELTGRCNFACTFCARSMKLREQKDMDRGLYERLVVEMAASGVEELGLFYLGESFLVKWLPEAIAYAKKWFPYVFLTTNGSLATPKRMRECFEAGLDSLKFSLNYADERQFEEIACVKPALFKQMMGNIRASRSVRDEVERRTGHRCGLYASYIEYDEGQGTKIKEVVEELRGQLDEIYALPLYNQASFVTQREEAKGWKPTPGNRGRAGNLRDPLPCWAMFTEGHISWDGKLTGCCFSHTPDFDFGDLREEHFLEAWNSGRAQWFREHHLRKDVTGTPCEGCALIT